MLPTKFQFIGTKWFQRRRFKCEKLTDKGCQVMAKVHMAFWLGELKTEKDPFSFDPVLCVAVNDINR
jgi:hypothetical protein